MKFLTLISFCLTLGILSRADADLPGLSSEYMRRIQNTRDLIISRNLFGGPFPTSCPVQMLKMVEDNVLNITMAFGYLDVTGQNYQRSETDYYGNGDVLDIPAKNAMEAVLTQRCLRQKHFACGFKKRGEYLTKRINNRFASKNLQVNIHLVAPSVSTSDAYNQGPYAQQQRQHSQYARSVFLNSLSKADAVIYMGHARSGGGPDFFPPVLNSNGSVNYSHYRQQQTGINEMLSVLKSSASNSPVIGVLACESSGLFAGRIKRASPGSLLVTADSLFNYEDILPTGYAMLEALIGQRCATSFNAITKVQPNSSSFLDIRY